MGVLGFPIRAQVHSAWQNVLSVDAELPFFCLGSPVLVLMEDEHELLHGNIRWVSVYVLSDSGVLCINIGIEMDGDSADDDVLDGWDDELDPVCTPQFVEHSHALDLHLRQRRAPP